MRVVFLMDQMYIHGGGEKILSLKMNALADKFNYEVFLCTTEQANKHPVYPISKRVKCSDFKINYDRKNTYFHPLNLIKIIKHYFILKKELKKIKPDIIISVSQSPEQFFLPFINRSIPKLKEFHSSGFTKPRPISLFQKLKYQLFLIYSKYNYLIVLNRDEIQYYPFKNVIVIPNFIVKQPQILKKTYFRKNIIIAAGRIAPVKQFDHLIKAWHLIAPKYPNWEVHIYGEGDLKLITELKNLIAELNVKNIYLKGATDNIQKKMQEASLYALTSKTECFPMVLLESMACGLPIVSYNCPHGPKNIISNGKDGILVKHNDYRNFSKVISKLIDDDKLRDEMSKLSIKNVRRFSKERIMKQWIELFNLV